MVTQLQKSDFAGYLVQRNLLLAFYFKLEDGFFFGPDFINKLGDVWIRVDNLLSHRLDLLVSQRMRIDALLELSLTQN